MNTTLIKVVNNVRYLLSLQWLCELDIHKSELIGWAYPHTMYTRCKRCGLKLTDSFHEEIERAKGANCQRNRYRPFLSTKNIERAKGAKS